MSELDEQYVDSSELGESPLPGPLERSPRDTSERPRGTEFQRAVAEAIETTEFQDTWNHGIPLRRGGRQLHISYQDSMRMLWDDGTP